jgi:serine protease Do
MGNKTKNFFAIIALAVVFGAGLHGIRSIATAQAGFLGSLWQDYVVPWSPFAPEAEPMAPAEGAGPVELYKPVLDYEKAVVAGVKKAAPAVVSIIVSKNVPIIEDCPVQPFLDIPEEYQDFFEQNFRVTRPCQKGTQLREIGGGSGFIISTDGMIVTNRHVVLDAKAAYTVFTNDGKKYEAKALARDPVQDIAILKIEASGLPTVELGDSDTIELGQTAIAIGNALAEFRNTVSVGVVSGLARNVTASGQGIVEDFEGVIQTDTAINPGNSGGPLLNLKGEVIGINTAVVSDAQSIGFAIPINRAKRAIRSVQETGEIQSPYLGIRYIMLTPEFAKKQELPVEYGALVRGSGDGPAVIPDSPAARAGLLAEDIILEVNGRKLEGRSLGSTLADYSVGETVMLKVRRGENELSVSVTLAKRPLE